MTQSTSAQPIQLLAVVIPVRDEAERIDVCLAALRRAARSLSSGRRPPGPDPRLRVVVVLDACADESADIVARHRLIDVVPSRAGRVGAARAVGVEHVLRSESMPRHQIWIATTDADSVVPDDWLSHQLDVAAGGADLLRGLVQPDGQECGPAAYQAWSDAYRRGAGHPHVHGANLGIRADAYVACGGFDRLASVDEDVLLVRRARELGRPIVASAGAVVTTSGRLVGRVREGGFADYLAARVG
jgi:glycosyltransferase involved in cell wall biosynthesis